MSYEPPGGTPPPPQPAWQPPPSQGWQTPAPGAPYPAGAYGAGYAYTPSQPSYATKGLSTALLVLLIVSSLAAIFVVAAFFHRASVVDDLTNSTFREVQDADDTVSGAVGLFGFALLATGVVWIIWQFRYAKNAERLRGNYGLSSGWAIGGWFIPFGWFVLPELQLFQAARASDPDLPAGQPASAGRAPSSLVPWWILLDLAWLFFSFGRATRPSDSELRSFADLDNFVRADRISGVSAILFIAAGVVAIFVVRACTDRQNRALAGASATAYSAPQPWQQPAPYSTPPSWQPPAPAPQSWPPPAPPPPPPPPPQQQWPPPPAPPPD